MFLPKNLAGKYLQWFPSRSGSFGSTFTAQVSWSRFVWHWSLAVLSFPPDWESSTTNSLRQQEMLLSISPQRNGTALSVPAANAVQVSQDSPSDNLKTCYRPVRGRQEERENSQENRQHCQPVVLLQHADENNLFSHGVYFGFQAYNHGRLA